MYRHHRSAHGVFLDRFHFGHLRFAAIVSLPHSPRAFVYLHMPFCSLSRHHADTNNHRSPHAPSLPPRPYHFFLGDGMVHQVELRAGEATYRRRFVRTPSFCSGDRWKRGTFCGGIEGRTGNVCRTWVYKGGCGRRGKEISDASGCKEVQRGSAGVRRHANEGYTSAPREHKTPHTSTL